MVKKYILKVHEREKEGELNVCLETEMYRIIDF